MDPQAALEDVRATLEAIREAERDEPECTCDCCERASVLYMSELVDTVSGLVNWLDSGGFLPSDWGRP